MPTTSSDDKSARDPATGTPNSLNSEPKAADDHEGQAKEAYNEETGEINWDCPCLGAMTKPPCGETFKAAFSCFVYSKEEPKGLDCIAQFRAMQECFREHPDIYGPELSGDDSDSDDDADSKDESDSDSSFGRSTANSDSGSATESDDDDDDDDEDDDDEDDDDD